ncbi:MAG: hypothetical protein ACI9H8_000001, partial [Lysobacterales bacterium]
ALSCYSAFRLQKLRENLIVFFCKLSRMIFVLRDVKRHGSLDGISKGIKFQTQM